MDYENFKEKLIEDIKERIEDAGINAKVETNTVNKLNESYDAITITPESSNIGMNLPVEKFYGAMEDGRSYEEIVDKAMEVIDKGITDAPQFNVEDITDYSKMKDKLAMEVVSIEANKEMLDTVPHQNIEDISICILNLNLRIFLIVTNMYHHIALIVSQMVQHAISHSIQEMIILMLQFQPVVRLKERLYLKFLKMHRQLNLNILIMHGHQEEFCSCMNKILNT